MAEPLKIPLMEAQKQAQQTIDLMKSNPTSHDIWSHLFGSGIIANNPIIVYGGSYGGSLDLAFETLQTINEIHVKAGCDQNYPHQS